MFLNFNLWLPIKTLANPLEQTIFRMRVFFWIKKTVFLPVKDEIKKQLRMRANPEFKEPMNDNYFVKHYAIMTAKGRQKITQYRGSSTLFLRHTVKGKVQ